jgi:glucose-1-phosphate cytidylyltransferase
VLEPGVLDYVAADDVYFQKEPLERLAADGQLMAYRHDSFWQCMDTLRDKVLLQELWDSDCPPWKVWS